MPRKWSRVSSRRWPSKPGFSSTGRTASARGAFPRCGILRVQQKRVRISFTRLGFIACPLVGDPETRPSVRIAIVDVQGGIEVLNRLIKFPGGNQALAARLVRSGGKRIAINGIVEIRDRLRMLALALIDQATGMKGLGALRIEFDRRVEVAQGRAEISLGAEQISASQ